MRFNVSRRFKQFAIAALFTVAAFGWLMAQAGKQRDASGTITLELCKKGANGQWEVIDRVKSPVNFTASVMDLAAGKEITSNFSWRGTSEKGLRAEGRMLRAGKVKIDVTRGLLELDLPMEATVNGKKIPLNVKLTSESISSPTGLISGKKASLNNGTLTAGIVGFSVIKQRDLVDELAKVGDNNGARKVEQKAEQKKEGIRTSGVVGGSGGLSEELIVVMRGDGTVRAK
ncbi:MAG TPA: hypothetical protein PLK30_06275 [Blastocatellia bacterium]|nr:hypothetical protein [Blastocatellia bacterium]